MSDARMPVPATALDRESTIVAVVELSARSWLVGAQVAGVPRQCRQKLAPSAAALLEHLDHLRRRAEGAGKRVGRVVLAYEAGRDGFWLARWLIGRGIEGYVIQPSSVPVERRARRAKTDGGPLPAHAKARLARLLDRLELVLEQIRVLEEARDAVAARDAAPGGEADGLIRRLAGLKGIGPELATLLAWEAFVRPFRDRRALAAYAGLTGTPFDSGDRRREQGIAKAGNRRLRAALVELAWLWLRYQPDSALAAWFRHRTQAAGGRMRKVTIVALARKLLVALWRFCREGVVPEGAALKAA